MTHALAALAMFSSRDGQPLYRSGRGMRDDPGDCGGGDVVDAIRNREIQSTERLAAIAKRSGDAADRGRTGDHAREAVDGCDEAPLAGVRLGGIVLLGVRGGNDRVLHRAVTTFCESAMCWREQPWV